MDGRRRIEGFLNDVEMNHGETGDIEDDDVDSLDYELVSHPSQDDRFSRSNFFNDENSELHECIPSEEKVLVVDVIPDDEVIDTREQFQTPNDTLDQQRQEETKDGEQMVGDIGGKPIQHLQLESNIVESGSLSFSLRTDPSHDDALKMTHHGDSDEEIIDNCDHEGAIINGQQNLKSLECIIPDEEKTLVIDSIPEDEVMNEKEQESEPCRMFDDFFDLVSECDVVDRSTQLEGQWDLFDKHFGKVSDESKAKRIIELKSNPIEKHSLSLYEKKQPIAEDEAGQSEYVFVDNPEGEKEILDGNKPLQLQTYLVDDEKVLVRDTIPCNDIVDMAHLLQDQSEIFERHFETVIDLLDNNEKELVDEQQIIGSVDQMELESEVLGGDDDDFSWLKSDNATPTIQTNSLHNEKVRVVETVPLGDILNVGDAMKEREDTFDRHFDNLVAPQPVQCEKKQRSPVRISFGHGHDVYVHVRCAS